MRMSYMYVGADEARMTHVTFAVGLGRRSCL